MDESEKKTAEGDANIPSKQTRLLSKCVKGDSRLDELMKNAIEATRKLQQHLGTAADAMLLVDAPIAKGVKTDKPLKKGTVRLLIPLCAPVLEVAFETKSQASDRCSTDFRKALNVAKDEYLAEMRRKLIEESKDDGNFDYPRWLLLENREEMRRNADKRIPIHPGVYRALCQIRKSKLYELYGKLTAGLYRRALNAHVYSGTILLKCFTPPWLPQFAQFVHFRTGELLETFPFEYLPRSTVVKEMAYNRVIAALLSAWLAREPTTRDILMNLMTLKKVAIHDDILREAVNVPTDSAEVPIHPVPHRFVHHVSFTTLGGFLLTLGFIMR